MTYVCIVYPRLTFLDSDIIKLRIETINLGGGELCRLERPSILVTIPDQRAASVGSPKDHGPLPI